MRYDFATCENADVPHVKVYRVETDETVCEVPIVNGDVRDAEDAATFMCFALTEYAKR